MTEKPRGQTLVLVTGASGFIGSHLVSRLLEEGYRVRGTVRSLKNEKKVGPVRKLNIDRRLELVEADLLVEEGWDRVVEGCDYVQHVASPFPIVADEACVTTAIQGTLNVLKAAQKARTVRKVVLTSSCVAVNEGHPQNKVFNEESWSNLDNKKVGYYPRSKTLAEKAAWEFVDGIKEGNKFKLTVINPVLVVGPPLIDEQGSSITIIRRFLNHEMPAVPALQLALVHVHDVVRCHIEAMRRPQSDGERILCASQPSFWFRDIAKILSKEFKSQGYHIASLQVPFPLLWIYSFVDAQAASILDRVGHEIRFDNSKAKKLLDIDFVDPTEGIIQMGYALIERGICKRTSGYKGVPEKYKESVY